MNIKIRIGNIGFRPTCFIGTTPDYADQQGDFVYYEPCSYYGKLEEYLKKGYEDKGDCLVSIRRQDLCNHTIHKRLFEMEEICYSVATLKYDPREGCCDLESIGPRLLELSKQDRNDFFEVYNLANDKLIEYYKNKEKENQ